MNETKVSGKKCFELSRHTSPLGLLERVLLESSRWHSKHCSLIWKTWGINKRRLLFKLSPSLIKSELWPTPTATERENDVEAIPSQETLKKFQQGKIARVRKTRAPTLTTAVKLWPTPRASEYKGTGPLGSKSQKYRLEKGYLDATVQDEEQQTGGLNPKWVTWLMGYPMDWLDNVSKDKK